MVRRLDGGQLPLRQAPPQSLFLEEKSRRVSKADAPTAGENRPPQTTALAIAQAWAEATTRSSLQNHVAADLARALGKTTDQLPEAAIPLLQADWKTRYSTNTRRASTYYLKKLTRILDGKLGTNMTAAVERPSRYQPRDTTIKPDELQRLLQQAVPHMRMFVSLMAFAALRFNEAHQIGWDNYDEEKQTLTIAGKGGAIHTIPAPPEITAMLAVTPRGPGSFTTLLRGKPLSKESMRKAWNKLKRAAGVPENVNPHDLRRTAAVGIYRRTTDIYAAKQLLRHDALSSTATYLVPYHREAMQKVRDDMLRGIKESEKVQ